MELQASRYNVLVDLEGGRTLAYNGMSGALAVWEADETRAFRDVAECGGAEPGNAATEDLLRGGYVVGAEVDELAILKQQYVAHRYNRHVMTMTVAPTLACNFGCDYCFQGQDKPQQTMQADVQDAVVALVERAAPSMKQLGIAWYGGEPLMRPKIIESLSERMIAICDARGIRYEAMIVTNGFLLTADIARMLERYRVRAMQITLDGRSEYHDERRSLLNGKPTFDRIVENMSAALAASSLRISVRVNVDSRNAEDVHGLIDDLDAAGLGGDDRLNLYFAPVESMTEGCHEVQGHCMTKRAYGTLEADLFRHGYDVGLAQLPYPPRFHGVCAAVKPRGLVVTPSGDVHKCWDTVTFPEHKVGTIFDLEALAASEAALRWVTWSPFENDVCRNCKLLPNCAGACAYKFLHQDATRGEAASLPCPSWKFNIVERLLLRAEKMGALSPDDWNPEIAKTVPEDLCVEMWDEAAMAVAGAPAEPS